MGEGNQGSLGSPEHLVYLEHGESAEGGASEGIVRTRSHPSFSHDSSSGTCLGGSGTVTNCTDILVVRKWSVLQISFPDFEEKI